MKICLKLNSNSAPVLKDSKSIVMTKLQPFYLKNCIKASHKTTKSSFHYAPTALRLSNGIKLECSLTKWRKTVGTN